MSNPTTTTGPLVPLNPDAIPAELKALKQWVCWRWEERDGEATKPPINAHSGCRAETDNPETWATFADALAAAPQYAGIGFVFSANDPFVGVDLDHCRDPDTGEIAPWAQAIIRRFNTYTEVSPSGKGVKLFCRGTLPEGAWHKKRVPDAALIDGKPPAIEMYSAGRYFTVTGAVPEETP